MAAEPTPARIATLGPDASPDMRHAVVKQAKAEGLDVNWRGAYLVISRNG